jgi:DNA-binding CsgD family transcriptional regulator
MILTERERQILHLYKQGLSDYKIARRLRTDPPSVTRSRKNAHQKLSAAIAALEWAAKEGLPINTANTNPAGEVVGHYLFYM